MSHQIIKQPDGRLALWSSVVGDFIITDATGEELGDYFADQAARKSREQNAPIIEAVLEDRARDAYFQFTMTWDEAQQERAEIHGSVGP